MNLSQDMGFAAGCYVSDQRAYFFIPYEVGVHAEAFFAKGSGDCRFAALSGVVDVSYLDALEGSTDNCQTLIVDGFDGLRCVCKTTGRGVVFTSSSALNKRVSVNWALFAINLFALCVAIACCIVGITDLVRAGQGYRVGANGLNSLRA